MIHVGVIGAGYWGMKHLRVFHELSDSNLTVVCDENPDQLEVVRHYYPKVTTFHHHMDLLDSDIDAVVVATPVNSHFDLTRDALLAGKHVLVEKPLTCDVESSKQLIRLAEERGLTLMVGHTYQFHPAVKFLRDFLASRELGDLYSIDSSRLNLGVFRTDVDVLWDLAPHDISIFLFLLNQYPLWISAKASAHVNRSLAEVSYLSLGFQDQVLAHTHISWLNPSKVRQLTLVGSKRMVVFDDVTSVDQIRIYDKSASLGYKDNGASLPKVYYQEGEVRAPFIPPAEPLKLECSHFLECIETGKRPQSDGYEALRVISIIEAAHQSIAKGGEQIALDEYQSPYALADVSRIDADLFPTTRR